MAYTQHGRKDLWSAPGDPAVRTRRKANPHNSDGEQREEQPEVVVEAAKGKGIAAVLQLHVSR